MAEAAWRKDWEVLQTGVLEGALAEPARRVALLKALYREIAGALHELSMAEFSDFHVSKTEFCEGEWRRVLYALKCLIRNTPGWGRVHWCAPDFGSFPWNGRRQKIALGIVLIASGDQEPLADTMLPVAAAIAAGNAVMVALSLRMQATALVMKRILEKVFPASVLAVEMDDFTELLKGDFALLYPGTDAVRTQCAKACAARRRNCLAAEEVCSIVPAIVDASANLRRSVKLLVRGKFYHAGQARYAPDYLLVHREIKERFVCALRAELRKRFGDNPQEAEHFCRIAGAEHYETLHALLHEGNLIAGGECVADELYVAPTVLEGAAEDGALLREPLRGPVLVLFEYEAFGDALAFIKRHSPVDAVYFFGNSAYKRKRILQVLHPVYLANNRIPERWGIYGAGSREAERFFNLFCKEQIVALGQWNFLRFGARLWNRIAGCFQK